MSNASIPSTEAAQETGLSDIQFLLQCGVLPGVDSIVD